MPAQRENLWGRYRPPTGLSLHYVNEVPGIVLGGTLTVKVEHHQPEPSLIERFALDEFECLGMPHVLRAVWEAYAYGGGAQAVLGAGVAVARIRAEHAGP